MPVPRGPYVIYRFSVDDGRESYKAHGGIVHVNVGLETVIEVRNVLIKLCGMKGS